MGSAVRNDVRRNCRGLENAADTPTLSGQPDSDVTSRIRQLQSIREPAESVRAGISLSCTRAAPPFLRSQGVRPGECGVSRTGAAFSVCKLKTGPLVGRLQGSGRPGQRKRRRTMVQGPWHGAAGCGEAWERHAFYCIPRHDGSRTRGGGFVDLAEARLAIFVWLVTYDIEAG